MMHVHAIRTRALWIALLLLISALLLSLAPHQSSAQSAWAPGVSYSAGALVTYGGSTYRCLQAHTSQAGWEPPNVPALWQIQSGTQPSATQLLSTATRTRTRTRTRTPTGPTATRTRTRTRTNTPAGPSATRTRTSTSAAATATRTRTATSSATPISGAPIFNQGASNDATSVFYQFSYSGSYSFYRVYIDADQSAASGYATSGLGVDYLLENASLYAYSGTGSSWSWTLIKAVGYSNSAGTASWTLARADIGEGASPNAATLLFQVEAPLATSPAYSHTYSGGPTATRTATSGSAQPTNVTYQGTTAIFANPERGFYHHTGNCDSSSFSLSTLQSYRTGESISLVMCIFYMSSFKTSPLSQAALDHLGAQLGTVRSAGLKAIIRLAYTASQSGDDTSKAWMLAHLDQLRPILQSNSDVIAVVQTGMIGAWGEWYYTQNFGNAGVISATDWSNRKEIVDKLLSVLPSTRMVQLRTPNFKRTMYGTTALASSEAFNGTARARIGHHNDCFLASADDFGTYINPSVEYPYLEAETRYLPMGGETCAPNPPRSECPTALSELSRFHWSYVNVDYRAEVLSSWSAGGCMDQIKQRLGYRLALQQGSYPAAIARGGTLNLQLTLQNGGWAAPYNPRGRDLILRNTGSGAIYRFALASDPRSWLPGTPITISQGIAIPTTMPAGSYELLLHLPDPAPALSGRPEYAIRLANANTWEPATGFNKLLHTVSVQ